MRLQFLLAAITAAVVIVAVQTKIDQEKAAAASAARCVDLAWYYGVAPGSDPTHRRLPDGVSIVERGGQCWRTDTWETVDENGKG